MYEEYFRRSPPGSHASLSSSASVSDTSSTCSSSGVTRHTPSLRSSRYSPPLVWEEGYEHAGSYERGKTWRTQSQCGGGEISHERGETRGDTRGGGERHSCNDIYPTRYKVTRDQNDHRHHGREVNSWTSRKQYTYDLPHITNSQGIPGSPFLKNRPWSPDEEHIQVAACPRLGVVNDRIDQYPAPPQHFGDPRPSTGWDGTFHSSSSSATAHTINDSVPKPARRAMMKRQPMSSGEALGISSRQGSRSNMLVSPFRFVFDWVCSALGLARSSSSPTGSSSSKPELYGTGKQSDSPARRSECAYPKVEGDDEDTTHSDGSTDCCAAAAWLGSDEDDDGEESEVEEMVCTPSCLPGSQMNRAVDDCRSNQSCEESYLHLDLEWDEYDKLLEDHTGAPGHLIHRRSAGSHHLIFSSGSPTIPFATIGLPHLPVDPSRFKPEITGRCISDMEYCDEEEEEGHVRFVGEEEEEESQEVYCGALLSDHMYPRWQHYRFTAVSDARNELLIEERVPVTYLDEGMADAERLQDARRRKLELEWGRPLPGAIDWKDVRSWR